MSNYTPSTDFAAKDSLLSGNPNKIVKGTEITAELTSIAAAVATKADSSSSNAFQAGATTLGATTATSLNSTPIGNSAPSTGAFTTLSASSGINATAIGNTSASTGAFTTLSASGSVTLSGGTANGVAYLNGSKVLTTGSALTFDGSKFLVGSNTAGYGTLNVARDATSPYASLTITDEASATNTVGIYLRQSGAAAAGISTAGAPLAFYLGGAGVTEVARFSTDGNLGLGVTPSAWASGKKALQIGALGNLYYDPTVGNVSYASNAYLSAASTYTYQFSGLASDYRQVSGTHTWYTAPSGTAGNAITFTQSMKLDASGTLGLGVTPQAWSGNSVKAAQLSTAGALWAIEAGAGNRQTLLTANIFHDTGVNKYIVTDGAAMYSVNTNGEHIWSTAPSGTAGNAITLTQSMKLDASGNLLVAKTALNDTTIGTGIAASGIVTTALAASTNATNTYVAYSTGAGAYRFYVDMGGTVHATSTSITAISDVSLKENIRDLDTGLAQVMALKPRRYDWKNGDAQNVAGFIAQELETVLPDLVYESKYSIDEVGNDVVKKSIKMGDILPTLVKAMQEQQALIVDLQARLAALEAQ